VDVVSEQVMEANVGREFIYTRADFVRIRELIYEYAGITLADAKQQLVYSRLSRRLRELNLKRFADYIAVLRPGDAEWQHFTNALTTNLTSFFREQYHFPILAEHVQKVTRRPIRLWSAAASTGEEPYSMAMTMVDLFGSFQSPVQIIGSDVDTQVLETAARGIYPLERVEKIPLEQKRRFFKRGKGSNLGKARVVPELQRLVDFRRINLLDSTWQLEGKFDAIFCRNVMIYFDKQTQRALIEKFLRVLQPDGLLFTGHSESFFHVGDLIAPIGKTVYRAGSRGRPVSDGD